MDDEWCPNPTLFRAISSSSSLSSLVGIVVLVLGAHKKIFAEIRNIVLKVPFLHQHIILLRLLIHIPTRLHFRTQLGVNVCALFGGQLLGAVLCRALWKWLICRDNYIYRVAGQRIIRSTGWLQWTWRKLSTEGGISLIKSTWIRSRHSLVSCMKRDGWLRWIGSGGLQMEMKEEEDEYASRCCSTQCTDGGWSPMSLL